MFMKLMTKLIMLRVFRWNKVIFSLSLIKLTIILLYKYGYMYMYFMFAVAVLEF